MYKSKMYKGHLFPTTYWSIISYFIFCVPKKQSTGFPFWKVIRLLDKYFILLIYLLSLFQFFFSHCHKHKGTCIDTVSSSAYVWGCGEIVLFSLLRMEYRELYDGTHHEQKGKLFPLCCEFNKIFKCLKISIVKRRFLYTGQNLRLKFC